MMRRRPAANVVLRRPAAKARTRGGAEKTPEEKYKAGDSVDSHLLPAGCLHRGDHLCVDKAVYFGREVDCAGRVHTQEWHSGERHLLLEVSGAQDEGLLKHVSGSDAHLVRLHLCQPRCNQKRDGPNPSLSCATKVEDGPRGGLDDQPRGWGRRRRFSQRPRRVEEKRSCEREGKRRKKFQQQGEQEEKEEKERQEEVQEGEEEATGRPETFRGGGGVKESKGGCQEDARSLVCWNRDGSIKQGPAQSGTQSQESAPKRQGFNFELGKFFERFIRGTWFRRRFSRSKQDTENSDDGTRAPVKQRAGADDAACSTAVGLSRRGDRRQAQPHVVLVQPGFLDAQNQWCSSEGASNTMPCQRPAHRREASPSLGHLDPMHQGIGAPSRRNSMAMAHGIQAGGHTPGRAVSGEQTRGTDRQEGGEDGQRGQTGESELWRPHQRQRKGKRQRQRKRQEQEQRKGGRRERQAQRGLAKQRIEERRKGLPSEGVEKRGEEETQKNRDQIEEKRSRHDEGPQRRRLEKDRKLVRYGCIGTYKMVRGSGRKKRTSLKRREMTKDKEERGIESFDQERKRGQEELRAAGGGLCLPSRERPPVDLAASRFTANFSNDLEKSCDISLSSGLGRARKSEGNLECEMGSLGNLYDWLEPRVDEYLARLCKTTPTGRVFPLPSSPQVFSQLFPNGSKKVLQVLRVLVCCLNSLNGEGSGENQIASEFQQRVLSELMLDCERVCAWKVGDAPPSWSEFFKVKGIDYKGEEIMTAQTMTWNNVKSALPSEVGGVELEAVVEKGCLHYVKHFAEYLLDPQDQVYVKPPKVMVPPEDWYTFCDNLLTRGVFAKVHEDDIYRVQDKPVLSGLFGVSKQEFDGPYEVQRIIMNLIPLNSVCRGFEGDVGTLPSWSGMVPLNLQPHEDLVVSSEDVRAFFYIFKVPPTWRPFLAFNRPLPEGLAGNKQGKWYPCSAVLPMGFKNSVSLAQHVRRVIVKRTMHSTGLQGSEAELRKDRPFTSANPMHRIYLDNFDQLEKTSKEAAEALKGSVSPLVQGSRDEYLKLGVPRHPKKAVSRATIAEVQGAVVDGVTGLAHPKIEKVAKYAHLARLILEAGEATQRQMQVVGGGFVYMCLFRRPLLSSLNHICSL